jgi:hypothetical protein
VPGRLNIFQTMMVRWRELHPYLAVHVVRVPAPLDRERLQAEIRRLLERLGLTGFVFAPDRRRFRFEGGPATVTLKVLPGGADPRGALDREIEAELNTAFPRGGRIEPFRFFVIDAADAFHLGLAYDHFIAAADSIVVLLADIVETYVGTGVGTGAVTGAGATTAREAASNQPLRVYPATYGRLFMRYPGHFVRGLARLPAIASSCRRSVRPPAAAGGDRHNGFACFRIDPAGFRAMSGAAAAWGVTLNDLFMAILLQALSPLAEQRRHAVRRRELAVASIMNIRREYQPGPRHTFGQFLGAFRVSHPVPPGATLESLARDVHAETARIKRGKLYLQSLLALGLTGVAWRFLSDDRRDRIFPKHYPVWAGVTGINVNSLWVHAAERFPSIEYLRAVSTGPLAPLVFAITTMGEVLQVGITYRSAAVSRKTVDGLAAGFLRTIAALPSCVDSRAP